MIPATASAAASMSPSSTRLSLLTGLSCECAQPVPPGCSLAGATAPPALRCGSTAPASMRRRCSAAAAFAASISRRDSSAHQSSRRVATPGDTLRSLRRTTRDSSMSAALCLLVSSAVSAICFHSSVSDGSSFRVASGTHLRRATRRSTYRTRPARTAQPDMSGQNREIPWQCHAFSPAVGHGATTGRRVFPGACMGTLPAVVSAGRRGCGTGRACRSDSDSEDADPTEREVEGAAEVRLCAPRRPEPRARVASRRCRGCGRTAPRTATRTSCWPPN